MLDKLLDFIHSHKGKIGVAMVFLAGGLSALGYHHTADAILTVGTLVGVGRLPNGPNPKAGPNA